MATTQEQVIVKMGLDATSLKRGLSSARSAVGDFQSGMARLGIGFGGAALFGSLARGAVQYAGTLNDMSQSLGLSTGFLQEYTFAAGQSGVSSDKARASLERFTQVLGEARENGAGPAAEAFKKLGIAINDGAGNEEILESVIQKLESFSDVGERASIASDIFGKSGVRLLAMFREFQELRQKADIIDPADIAGAAEFDDYMEALMTKSKTGFAMMIGYARDYKQFVDNLRDKLLGGNGTDDWRRDAALKIDKLREMNDLAQQAAADKRRDDKQKADAEKFALSVAKHLKEEEEAILKLTEDRRKEQEAINKLRSDEVDAIYDLKEAMESGGTGGGGTGDGGGGGGTGDGGGGGLSEVSPSIKRNFINAISEETLGDAVDRRNRMLSGATVAESRGQFNIAHGLRGRADKLTEGINAVAEGADRGMTGKKLDAATEAVKALVELMQTGNVVFQPKNGE